MHNTVRSLFVMSAVGVFALALMPAEFMLLRVLVGVVIALSALAALIGWLANALPPIVARQRWQYKAAPLNVRGTLLVPNAAIHGKEFQRLLAHPDVNARTGGGLRKLIRWWHTPCADVHQEVMETNDVYQQVAPVTTSLTSTPGATVRALARAHVEAAMQSVCASGPACSIIRVRAIAIPLAIGFFHELVFGVKCPADKMPLFLGSLSDVLAATAGYSRGHVHVREALTSYLREHIERGGGCPQIFGQECSLSALDKAKYLQGVWFHTAPVQLMRVVCYSIANLAGDEARLAKLAEGGERAIEYLSLVTTETLRLYPGVTLTNHVASKDVSLTDDIQIPAGTNVLFDIATHHHTGFEDADTFLPERWETLNKRDANYVPFGAGKRRCPAERLCLIAAREVILGMLGAAEFHFPKSHVLVAGRARVAYDLCCIVRRKPVAGMRLRSIVTVVAWWEAIDVVRKSLTHFIIMPRNAREAFALKDLDGPVST